MAQLHKRRRTYSNLLTGDVMLEAPQGLRRPQPWSKDRRPEGLDGFSGMPQRLRQFLFAWQFQKRKHWGLPRIFRF